jgi:ABC-type antimicrobial peptide transport system permease subunit
VGIVVGLAAAAAVGFVHDYIYPPAPLDFRFDIVLLALVIGLVIGVFVGVRVASACRRLASR